MEDSSKELYQAAIDKWGKGSQIEMLIEESAELTLALQKFKRDPSQERLADVYDEMADVEIMLEQNSLIFDREKVLERKRFKLERLETTLTEPLYGKYQMNNQKLDDVIS